MSRVPAWTARGPEPERRYVWLRSRDWLCTHKRLRGIRLLDNGVVEEEGRLRALSPLGVGVQMGTVLVQEGITAGE